MSEGRLKLRWQHTLPEGGPDFIAFDPENCFDVPVARIRDSSLTSKSPWSWVANHPASADSNVFYAMGEVGGNAQSKREAADLAEAAHFRFLEAIDKLERRGDLERFERVRAARQARER